MDQGDMQRIDYEVIMVLEEWSHEAMLKRKDACEGLTGVNGGLGMLHVAERSEVSCDSVICAYLQASSSSYDSLCGPGHPEAAQSLSLRSSARHYVRRRPSSRSLASSTLLLNSSYNFTFASFNWTVLSFRRSTSCNLGALGTCVPFTPSSKHLKNQIRPVPKAAAIRGCET